MRTSVLLKRSTSSLPFACLLLKLQLSMVHGHGYVSHWAADGNTFEKAQKVPLDQTAFRAVSSNTGWIGSQYLDHPAFTCGSSETPGGTTAAPSGTIFSEADQSAQRTLSVKAGGKVEFIISGAQGQGFPHPNGHVQAYLGYCGPSKEACQNFDAATTEYVLIQADLEGISEKLRKQWDSKLDGHRWILPIPSSISEGSYIVRLELIAFGQSSVEEGGQDQYYVFCGQVSVVADDSTSVTNSPETSPRVLASDNLDEDEAEASRFKFPGAYATGNIDPHSFPTRIPINDVEGRKRKG